MFKPNVIERIPQYDDENLTHAQFASVMTRFSNYIENIKQQI